MLGLVQNQVVEFEPVLDVLPEEFTLRFSKPDSRGRGRLFLYLDGRIVEIGRTFHIMEKAGEVGLDGATGMFVMKRGSRAKFRCVFGGQHREVTIKC